MKKLLTLFLLFGLILSSKAADIIVNLNPASGADYNDAQSAVNAAVNGDVIYLQALPLSDLFLPSDVSYGNIVIDKQITIVGHGYFLETAGLGNYSASFRSVPLAGVSFILGSEGAVLRNASASQVLVDNGEITLERCYMTSLTVAGGSNLQVNSCYIESQVNSETPLILESSLGGHFFNNCLIGFNGSLDQEALIVSAINTNGAEFNHCNFVNGFIHLGSHFVHNCIFYESQITWLQGGVFNNNLFTISPFVTPTNPMGELQDGSAVTGDVTNQLADPLSLFQNTLPADLQWQLQSASPALGYGDDLDNAGMYTNTGSYRPSGLPDDGPVFIEVNYFDVLTTEIVLPIDFVVYSPTGNAISQIQWTVIPDDFFVGIQDYSTFAASSLVHGFLSIDAAALPDQGVIALNAIDDAGLQSGFQFFPYQKDLTPIVAPNLQSFEYFYNTDPGIGNGNILDIQAEVDFEGVVTFPTLVENGPTLGQNILFVRVFDANGGVGTTYYHEFQYLEGLTAECCDIDGDGVVALSDFLILLQKFGTEVSGCGNGDFNLDGIVGTDDFLLFLSFFGTVV